MRESKFYNLLVAGAPRGLNTSTNASPIECTTDAAHGLSTGDTVQIMGHTTNTNANGIWYITVTSATKFTLDGSTGNGVGDNSGTFTSPAPKALYVRDYKTIVVSYKTDGGGDYAGTIKFAGAISEDAPNFGATVSTTNMYDFIDAIDLEDNASIDGDTGVTQAGADDARMFQLNVDGLEWFTAVHTAGTAGELTLDARLFTEE